MHYGSIIWFAFCSCTFIWYIYMLTRFGTEGLARKTYFFWKFKFSKMLLNLNRNTAAITSYIVYCMLPQYWSRKKFITINSNIVLPPTTRSFKRCLSFTFPNQNSVCTSLLPHTCHMPCQYQPLRFFRVNNIYWGGEIIQLPDRVAWIADHQLDDACQKRRGDLPKRINPLTPELNPSAQSCCPDFYWGI
jgi:hypothetical protein